MFCAVHMLTLLHTEWVQVEVSVACAEHSPHSPHLFLTDWHRGVCMCAPSCAKGLRRTCWSVNSSSVTHLSCVSSLAEQLTVTLSKLWVMDIIKSVSSSNPRSCDITNGMKTTALYCKLEPRDLYLHFFFYFIPESSYHPDSYCCCFLLELTLAITNVLHRRMDK